MSYNMWRGTWTVSQMIPFLNVPRRVIHEAIEELGLEPIGSYMFYGWLEVDLWLDKQVEKIRASKAVRRYRSKRTYRRYLTPSKIKKFKEFKKRYKTWSNPKFLQRIGTAITRLDRMWHLGMYSKNPYEREWLRQNRMEVIRRLHDFSYPVAEITDIQNPDGKRFKRIVFFLNRKLFTVYCDPDGINWPINNTVDPGDSLTTVDFIANMKHVQNKERREARLVAIWFLQQTKQVAKKVRILAMKPRKDVECRKIKTLGTWLNSKRILESRSRLTKSE